jgi:TRAP-type mannitol/chloroaromatic compound transport system permease small subunit
VFVRVVDRLTDRVGRAAAWLILLMVLIGAFNALARHGGRFFGRSVTSNALLELQWYLFSAVFLLGAAFTLKQQSHVRVDAVYSRLSQRAQTLVNVIGTAVFLLPFCVVVLLTSWPPVRDSWRIAEGSPDPGGLARYPIKTLIPIAFALLLVQGVAELIRDMTALRRRTTREADHGWRSGESP